MLFAKKVFGKAIVGYNLNLDIMSITPRWLGFNNFRESYIPRGCEPFIKSKIVGGLVIFKIFFPFFHKKILGNHIPSSHKISSNIA